MKRSIMLTVLSVSVLAPAAWAREHGQHPQLRTLAGDLTNATSDAYRSAVNLRWEHARHFGRYPTPVRARQGAHALAALRELDRTARDFRAEVRTRKRDPLAMRRAWRDLYKAHERALVAVYDLPGRRTVRRELRQVAVLVERIRDTQFRHARTRRSHRRVERWVRSMEM